MSLANLPLVAPVQPDFSLCSSEYGAGIRLVDCLIAADLLISSDVVFPYAVSSAWREGGILSLPTIKRYG